MRLSSHTRSCYLCAMRAPATRFILLLSILVISRIATAAAWQSDTAFSLASPRNTVETHLKFLQPDSYHPEISANVFIEGNRTDKEAEELAIKLKQILDGSGIYILLEDIPPNPNYTDTLSQKGHQFMLTSAFPEILLVKVGNAWYYAESTAKAIPRLHKKVFPFGMDRLLKLMPQNGSKTILGLQSWQYIAMFFLILLCFLIHRVLTWFFARVITRILLRWGYKTIAYKYIRPLAAPFSMLAVTGIIWLMEPVLQLPAKMQFYVVIIIRVALPFFAFAVLYRMVDVFGVYLQRMAERTESKLDDQLVPLIRKALRTFVVVIGVLVILQNLDVNVTALLAGLSIGGLAVALAAQDTLKNFFGSVMIFVDRPFQIGHWITASEIDGTVEEVGFRSTRVRTFRNSLVSVPNGKLADMVIDNHGLRQYRRFYTMISVTYDTHPDIIELFVQGLEKVVLNHPRTRKDYYEIHLNTFAASSLDVLFYVFFAVPTWSEELRARHEIMLEVIHLAESLGIRFAFPTQTLHVENFPEKKSDTPLPTEDMDVLKNKIDTYLKGAEKRKALWGDGGQAEEEG